MLIVQGGYVMLPGFVAGFGFVFFPIASLFDALVKGSRGLRFAAPATNLIPSFLFYVGIIALVWAVVQIVVRVRGQV